MQLVATKNLFCPILGVYFGTVTVILFVLFIDDISDVVSDGSAIAPYADDTKIWRKIKS